MSAGACRLCVLSSCRHFVLAQPIPKCNTINNPGILVKKQQQYYHIVDLYKTCISVTPSGYIFILAIKNLRKS